MKPGSSQHRILPSGTLVTSDRAFNWQQHFDMLGRQVKKKCLIDFYDNRPVNGQTPVEQARFLAMDFETTGMDSKTCAIVSIGMVNFDRHRIFCSTARHLLVKPELPLTNASTRIHSITHNALSAAKGFHEHLPDLLAQMKNRIVVVHYHRIEREFLAGTVKRFYDDLLEFPMIDTMAVETAAWTPPPRPWYKRWGSRAADMPSMRLGDARSRYGLPVYRPHHALNDAIATAELFMAQLQTHYSAATPVSQLWL